MTVTLQQLNDSSAADFASLLEGIYEHSPWIPLRAAAQRPFGTLAALKIALHRIVLDAGAELQLALICAHPDLAGSAAFAGRLTSASSEEQSRAGLLDSSAAQLADIQDLNSSYRSRFGFPFIVAVRGPDGNGLDRKTIIATLQRRLKNQRAEELNECLYQISRIAELRLNALLGVNPVLGQTMMARAAALARWSDDSSNLTCAYLTEAHRNTAQQLADWMRAAGMEVTIDAAANVVGRYRSAQPHAKTLITGSHYDTVCNAGQYDGRAGILLAIAVVQQLHERQEKLPFDLEVIGFSEEEGVRFNSTFLGSSALAGQFDLALLDKTDAAGITLRDALTEAGHEVSAIPALARDATNVLGFVELHIEQGPVLLAQNLPAGIVTSIAGSSRYLVDLAGVASHAGTTPMTMRKDAAAAAAEIVLYVEQRCSGSSALVGTVGQLQVPHGSVNVIPGACTFSLDIRSTDDTERAKAVSDILNHLEQVCLRRGIACTVKKIVATSAVQCAPWLQEQLMHATQRAGVPVWKLPSGAGHDAMVMAKITDVAMLFTRCGNGGISHNPLETMTADDADMSAQIFLDFLRNLKPV